MRVRVSLGLHLRRWLVLQLSLLLLSAVLRCRCSRLLLLRKPRWLRRLLVLGMLHWWSGSANTIRRRCRRWRRLGCIRRAVGRRLPLGTELHRSWWRRGSVARPLVWYGCRRRSLICGPRRLLLLIGHAGLLRAVVLRVRRASHLLRLVVEIRRVSGRRHRIGLVGLLLYHVPLLMIHAWMRHLLLVMLTVAVV